MPEPARSAFAWTGPRFCAVAHCSTRSSSNRTLVSRHYRLSYHCEPGTANCSIPLEICRAWGHFWPLGSCRSSSANIAIIISLNAVLPASWIGIRRRSKAWARNYTRATRATSGGGTSRVVEQQLRVAFRFRILLRSQTYNTATCTSDTLTDVMNHDDAPQVLNNLDA